MIQTTLHRLWLCDRRAAIAITLLALWALLSAGRTLVQSVGVIGQNDDVSAFERRMQVVRPFLPTEGEVGFLSDISEPSAFFKTYLLTQYTLAPLVVTNIGDEPRNTAFALPRTVPAAAAHRIVIGVFVHEPSDTLLREQRLAVVQRFDGGIVLLRAAP